MSLAFTKLFSSITESTIWCESASTRLVWITMLAMADAQGKVHASIPGLANRARVSVEDCEKAIEKFLSPDRYSRTPDFEGRRVEVIDGGWRLLNYLKYREIGNPVRASLDMQGYVYYIGIPGGERVKIGFSKNPWARLDALRTAHPRLEVLATERGLMSAEKDRHRQLANDRIEGEWFHASPSLLSLIAALAQRDDRVKRGPRDQNGRVTTVVEEPTTVCAEAEAEAEAEKPTSTAIPAPLALEPAPISRFDDFWSAYPRKEGKKAAAKAWTRAKLDRIADRILDDVRGRTLRDRQWRDPRYIPHPATYLNNERWNDEITEQGIEHEGDRRHRESASERTERKAAELFGFRQEAVIDGRPAIGREARHLALGQDEPDLRPPLDKLL